MNGVFGGLVFVSLRPVACFVMKTETTPGLGARVHRTKRKPLAYVRQHAALIHVGWHGNQASPERPFWIGFKLQEKKCSSVLGNFSFNGTNF